MWHSCICMYDMHAHVPYAYHTYIYDTSYIHHGYTYICGTLAPRFITEYHAYIYYKGTSMHMIHRYNTYMYVSHQGMCVCLCVCVCVYLVRYVHYIFMALVPR